jgi:RHS repeat-associated protein
LPLSGSTVNVFRWVGELGYYFDIDRLAYYLRARPYNPAIARFLSRDPSRRIWNMYEYVDGTPSMSVDPSGRLVKCRPITAVKCVTRLNPQRIACELSFTAGYCVGSCIAPYTSVPLAECITNWICETDTGPRNCETAFPDVPVCSADYFKTNREACRKCNQGNDCRPDNGTTWGPGGPGDPIETPGLTGIIWHYACKKGNVLCPSSVLCGKCCVDTPQGPNVVTRCKCADPFESWYDLD